MKSVFFKFLKIHINRSMASILFFFIFIEHSIKPNTHSIGRVRPMIYVQIEQWRIFVKFTRITYICFHFVPSLSRSHTHSLSVSSSFSFSFAYITVIIKHSRDTKVKKKRKIDKKNLLLFSFRM